MSGLKIIFMGTPNYAARHLEGLIAAALAPIAVITQPDRPAGRNQTVEPTPVKFIAEKYGIQIYQPNDIRDAQWVQTIRKLSPDLIVVVAFGQIIPKSILDIPPHGSINVHPSLLPRHRGATPWQEAILQGDQKTGVTIMLMDEKMDHGPILAQKECDVAPDETTASLEEKTAIIGIPLLIRTIQKWREGSLTPQEQDHALATYTTTLKKESGNIDWSKTAQEIERMIRALNPWPGTWTQWHEKRVKILEVHMAPGTASHEKSDDIFFSRDDRLFARCAGGPSIEIIRIQMEGKNAVTGTSFIQGYLRDHPSSVQKEDPQR